jgi:hypothetical protein
MKPKVYLETSRLIERLLYPRSHRAMVEEHLADKWVCTSAYVLMEFRRRVTQSFARVATLTRALLERGHGELGVDDLVLHLATSPVAAFSRRDLEMAYTALANALGRPVEGVVSLPALVARLEFHIDRFEHDPEVFQIDELIDHIGCDLLKPEATLGDFIGSRLSCNAATARCQVADFLAGHQAEVEQLLRVLKTASRDQIDADVGLALQQVHQDPRSALGERTCWVLGDVLIVLECPLDALFYTSDHHFRLLCPALNRQLFETAPP